VFTRRQFLNVLTPLALPPLLARAIPRRAPLEAATLLVTRVAGWRFHEGPPIEASLREGHPLLLCREQQNVHDANAIGVHTPEGRKLGYVPRGDNLVIARLLDDGAKLRASVASITPPPAPRWERVTVRIAFQSNQGRSWS
jgi:hypothetical protein